MDLKRNLNQKNLPYFGKLYPATNQIYLYPFKVKLNFERLQKRGCQQLIKLREIVSKHIECQRIIVVSSVNVILNYFVIIFLIVNLCLVRSLNLLRKNNWITWNIIMFAALP